MQSPSSLALRATEIRKLILHMSYTAGAEGAHIGSALSIADIISVLYFDTMKVDPKSPEMADRDYFILSKGHGALAQYAALALRGYFELSELDSFVQTNTRIGCHPSAGSLPGLEMPAGSLGHGPALGCGIAVACKADGGKNRIFILVGDGESEEGSVWEAAQIAVSRGLDNLTFIVDRNGLQYGGTTDGIAHLHDCESKWRAFGWDVITVDGHDVYAVKAALDSAQSGPKCIVARTVKGKGVSFMENNNAWHHSALSREEYLAAMAELGGEDNVSI